MRPGETQEFHSFCQLMNLDPAGFSPRDPPDFVSYDHSIAVELVEYHEDAALQGDTGGSPKRKAESTARRLVATARRIYHERSKNPRMNAIVLMSNRWDGSADEQLVANALVDVILAADGREIDKWFVEDYPPHPLFGSIDNVIAYPIEPDELPTVWQTSDAAIVNVHVPSIEETIRRKDEKLAAYRSVAAEVWLLIYGSELPCVGDPESAGASTSGSITDELRNHVFSTGFDRIYFHDHVVKELLRLNTCARRA